MSLREIYARMGIGLAAGLTMMLALLALFDAPGWLNLGLPCLVSTSAMAWYGERSRPPAD